MRIGTWISNGVDADTGLNTTGSTQHIKYGGVDGTISEAQFGSPARQAFVTFYSEIKVYYYNYLQSE